MASHLAHVQAVRVTNFPTPSPTATPDWTYNIAIPHVDVGWGTFWIAAIGLIVAVLAAIYAMRAFKAAEADLKLSKANWEMATRSPKLAVSFAVEMPSPMGTQGCPRGNHITYHSPALTATVWNTVEGKKRCDAFYIEVVVPVEALSLPEQARLTTEPHMGFIRRFEVKEHMLFPGGGVTTVSFSLDFDFAARAGQFELSYRLQDDYNDYPAKGETPNGYLTTTVDLPIRQQFVFVNPRDVAEVEMQKILAEGYGNDEHWHDKYTHAFELLDAGGFNTPDERMKAAREIATRARSAT